MFNWLRGKVSKRKKRFQDGKFDLDLAYIGERIIAMGYPAQGFESIYRNDFTDVRKFLDSRHKDNYMVYNLCSERVYDPKCFYGRVERFPFDDHTPPHLDLIRQFCVSAKAWLDADEEHIAVVHCKAGKGRTGVMICALLVHMGTFPTAREAMSYYGKERTKNEKGVTIPSQRRYVGYYEKFLRSRRPLDHEIEIRPCTVKRVRLMNLPKKFMTRDLRLRIEVMDDPYVFDTKKAGIKPKWSKHNGQLMFDLEGKVEDIKGEFQVAVIKGGKTKFWLWYNSEFINTPLDETRRVDVDKAAKSKAFSNEFKVLLIADHVGPPPDGLAVEQPSGTAEARSVESAAKSQPEASTEKDNTSDSESDSGESESTSGKPKKEKKGSKKEKKSSKKEKVKEEKPKKEKKSSKEEKVEEEKPKKEEVKEEKPKKEEVKEEKPKKEDKKESSSSSDEEEQPALKEEQPKAEPKVEIKEEPKVEPQSKDDTESSSSDEDSANSDTESSSTESTSDASSSDSSRNSSSDVSESD